VNFVKNVLPGKAEAGSYRGSEPDPHSGRQLQVVEHLVLLAQAALFDPGRVQDGPGTEAKMVARVELDG
jgi:hypothetical protein